MALTGFAGVGIVVVWMMWVWPAIKWVCKGAYNWLTYPSREAKRWGDLVARCNKAVADTEAYLAKQDEVIVCAPCNSIIWNKPIPQPSTATCHICGKRDFRDNLADVGWMVDVMPGDIPSMFSTGAYKAWRITGKSDLFAHPDCAKIKRSDDGKGWVRVKK